MFAKLHLFVAVCVTVFVSEAYGQNQCVYPTYGQLVGSPSYFQQASLPPYVRDVKVLVTNPCGFDEPNGGLAKVCDNDYAPVAKFVDKYTVYVHRTGSLQGYATADIILYCPPPYVGSKTD